MLSVIGISYGDQWLTKEAIKAIAEAETVIGYQGFIDEVSHITKDDVVAFDVLDDIREGENFLIARVRRAVDAVNEGRKTVILSNGDVNIFGMSGAVHRELNRIERQDLVKQTKVITGISAFQIAAAHLGGPLSNGFATLALCIAEVPHAAVERKIAGAAQGDFVTVVYMLRHNAENFPDLHPEITNPKEISSQRQLKMINKFAEYREPHTPCVIATNIGRDDQSMHHSPLSDLPNHLDKMTANSILFVGASDTIVFDNILVSPTW